MRIGGVVIELISPTAERSTVHGFLERKGEGLHHLAFKTSDIQDAAESLKSRAFRLAQDPSRGAHGTRVLFVHPKDCHGVLIELVEKD
jgi:methylmalonyl-CoA epimerase